MPVFINMENDSQTHHFFFTPTPTALPFHTRPSSHQKLLSEDPPPHTPRVEPAPYPWHSWTVFTVTPSVTHHLLSHLTNCVYIVLTMQGPPRHAWLCPSWIIIIIVIIVVIIIIHGFYIALFSALEQTHCAHWHVIPNEWLYPFIARIINIHGSGVLVVLCECCMAGATWNAAVSAQVLCTPFNMHQVTMSLHSKPHR